MFTTPDRSLNTPAIDPNIKGTDRRSAPCNSPVNGMNFPAAAQERNDIIIPAEPIALAVLMVLPAWNCLYPSADARTAITPNMREAVREPITHC